MSEEKDSLDEIFKFMKQQRDELKLKMHLAEKDAQDEWAKLEGKWKDYEGQVKPLTDALKQAAENAGEQAGNIASAAADVAPAEVKEGYEKLRNELKEGYEKLAKMME